MATFPLIPTSATPPTGQVLFDDSGDSSDEENIEPLIIDFGNLDDSEDDDEYDDDDDEDDEDDEGGGAGELARLMNLGKPTTAFPMPSHRTQVQPFVPKPQTRPVVPVPTVQQFPPKAPKVATHGGLRLTLVQTQPPTTNPVVPTVTSPATTNPVVPTVTSPATTNPVVPTVTSPATVKVPTTLTVKVPTTNPVVPTVPFPATVKVPTTLTTLTLAPTQLPIQPTVQQSVQPKPAVPLIPQLGGIIPTTTPTPGIIQTNPITTTPLVPQFQGLTLNPQPTVPNLAAQPTVPNLAAQPTAKTVVAAQPTAKTVVAAQPTTKTVDAAAILEKMQGISVYTITQAPAQIPADINGLLQKETDETPEDFEARRRLTLQLASIPDYKLNNATAVTAGLIMMKKAKLGVSYDPDVEAAISYLTSLLQR